MAEKSSPFQLGDLVTVKANDPEFGLKIGDAGTIIYVYDAGSYEAEWRDENGDWDMIFFYEDLMPYSKP